MRSIYNLTFLFILTLSSVFLNAQCDITNMTWTNQPCSGDGSFMVILDFDHPEPNRVFSLHTLYTNLEFSVSELPVMVGPLPGYCVIENFEYDLFTSGCETNGEAPYQCCPNNPCDLNITSLESFCSADGVAMLIDFEEFGCLDFVQYEIIVEKYDGVTLLSTHNFGPYNYNTTSRFNSRPITVPYPSRCEYNFLVKVRDINSNVTATQTVEEMCCQCGVGLEVDPQVNCNNGNPTVSFDTYNIHENELFGVNGYTVSIDGNVVATLTLSDEQEIPIPAYCNNEIIVITVTDISDPSCLASREINSPCCPCELTPSNVTTSNCDNEKFNLEFELSETGSCIYGDYYFDLNGENYDVFENGNGIFSVNDIVSLEPIVTIEVCNTLAPYCFPLSFENPCYEPVTNDSCEIFSFSVDPNFVCQDEIAIVSFNFTANNFFGQNGYVVKYGSETRIFNLNDEKLINVPALCNTENIISIYDINNNSCKLQDTIPILCCPCDLNNISITGGQCDFGNFSIWTNLSSASGSCQFGNWTATINDSTYQLIKSGSNYTVSGIFSADSLVPIKICSEFNECIFDTIINPCYAFITDTNRIDFSVINVVNIKCNNPGYVTWEQNGALPDFKIYLDNILQPNQNINVIVNTSGFHTLTISDAFLQKSITFWIDNIGDTSSFDLQPVLVATSFERGFENDVYLTITNLSCKPVDAYVTLKFPNYIQYVGSYPSAIDQQNQLLEWYINNLVDSVKIHIKFKTLSIAPLNSKLLFEVNTLPSVDDLNPSNNAKQYEFLVTGSYDPNDKSASPSGKCDAHYILKDQVINYTIRFQNIGNSPARNVVIEDILNENFDLSTFRMITNSHHGFVLKDRNNLLSFRFDNINLAAQSDDEEGSKGFVSFEVKPKSNTPINTVLKNNAAIFFDFNDPIITNETFHTVVNRIPNIENEISLNTCVGEVFTVQGEEFTTDTIFTKNYIAKTGCDSTVIYNLTFDEPEFNTIISNLCYGETIVIDGNEYSESITIEIPTRCSGKTTHIVNFEEPLTIQLISFEDVLTLGGQIFENYTWVNCSDNSIVFTGQPSFTPTENGEYKVIVGRNGCFYESDCVSFLVSSKDLSADNGILLYPNPVINGVLNIKLNSTQERIKSVTINNSLGQRLQTFYDNQLQINVNEYKSGLYFIEVETDKKLYIEKVILK